MFKIERYKTVSGNCPLDDFIGELSKDKSNRNALVRIKLFIDLLAEFGYQLQKQFHGYVKHLSDELYELRPGNNRVIYFYYGEDQTYVLLHGFTKKAKKTPPGELEKVKKEMLDYKERKKKNGKKA